MPTKTYKIIRNSALCLDCGHEIESTHRHDFVTCKCGNISVDGGKSYLKRSWGPEGKYTDTSITEGCEEAELDAYLEEHHQTPGEKLMQAIIDEDNARRVVDYIKKLREDAANRLTEEAQELGMYNDEES